MSFVRTYYPPTPASEQKPFMTHVPHRNPEFKMHRTIGPAKNAVFQKPRGAIFELVDGNWELIFVHEVPQCTSPSCPKSSLGRYGRPYMTVVDGKAARIYSAEATARLYHFPGAISFLCHECYVRGNEATVSDKELLFDLEQRYGRWPTT